ncbi:uncharacterized protein V1510DRAFT_436889 [Dipodascopsis tothii]|uniref:uncharacterized protein n=1 Tax=Dipodascopsis tothii TaxID=44089 RepID=UPI0034CE796A
MNVNFTGNYRQGRSINLSGRKTDKSRESLLKNAASARAAREQTRRRTAAAGKIQAFFRARLAVRQARAEVRAWFEAAAATGRPLGVAEARMFVYFCAEADDYGALAALETVAGALGPADAAVGRGLAGRALACVAGAGVAGARAPALRILAALQGLLDAGDVLAVYGRSLRDRPDERAQVVANAVALAAPAAVLVCRLLATPRLAEALAGAAAAPLRARYGLETVLDTIRGGVAVADEPALWVLANVAAWAAAEPAAPAAAAQTLFIAAASVLLGQVSADALQAVDGDSSVSQALAGLRSRDAIDRALALPAAAWPAVCRYFAALVRVADAVTPAGARNEVRMALYLLPEKVLPLFWQAVAESPLFRQLAAGQGVAAQAAQDDVVGLFLQIAWHWLLMADDDEFFDDAQYGLPQKDVLALAGLLKTLVFDLIMAGLDVPLKADAVKVLRQLSTRNARRPFLPPGFLLATDRVNMNGYLADVAAEEESRWERERDGDDDDDDERLREIRQAYRVRAAVSPRVELLRMVPFMLPFDSVRVPIFDKFLELDRQANNLTTEYEQRWRRIHVEIRRSHMLEDAFTHMNGMGRRLKSLVGITFLTDFGTEAGIDGGGISKEFITGVCHEAFDPARGLFVENDEHMLYPSPAATSAEQLQYFEFLGRIIGKALYQSILVDVQFAPFFLSMLQLPDDYAEHPGDGLLALRPCGFDDLWSMDPELYRGLVKLKNYPGDFDDLGLAFTTTDVHGRTVELGRGGASVAVTRANRLRYIHDVAHYKLNRQVHRQATAFLRGLTDLVARGWLSMFLPAEIQVLISGEPGPIDISDWRRHTVYGGFDDADPTIGYFWDLMAELSDTDARAVLKFVTSVDKAPLQGFNALSPYFTIRNAGPDEERLPTTSTCVNLLKLPRYTTRARLRDKLMYSVKSGAGFDLS